jgi:hypothetical protein
LTVPVIVLSPGSGAGGAAGAVAAGSGVAAGVEPGSGLGDPHAAVRTTTRTRPVGTHLNIDLSRYKFRTMNLERQEIITNDTCVACHG